MHPGQTGRCRPRSEGGKPGTCAPSVALARTPGEEVTITPSETPPGRRARKGAKRALRHLALGAASALGIGLVALLLSSPDPTFLVSMGTGYVALVLLAVTLLLGPLDVLRGRHNPVHTGLRRDIGIWAAIVGGVHVILGFQRHMGGVIWKYFYQDQPTLGDFYSVRLDLFGLSNLTGLAATFILFLLLCLSNDVSLRTLGAARWKNLQRSNYAVFLLVVAHTFGYQLILERAWPWIGVAVAVAVGVASLQLLGFLRVRRRGLRRRASSE